MMNKKTFLPRFLSKRYNIWKSTSYLQNEKKIKKLAKYGQRPQAMIISCCDSRVNVDSIFGAKEGDFFIHRNVANIIPTYKSTKTDHSTFAAIEYALKELKVPNFVVLGHTNCGGIKAGHSQYSKGENKKLPRIKGDTIHHSYATDKIPSELTVPSDAVVKDKNSAGELYKRRIFNDF